MKRLLPAASGHSPGHCSGQNAKSPVVQLQRDALPVARGGCAEEVKNMWKWTIGFRLFWWALGGYNKCY